MPLIQVKMIEKVFTPAQKQEVISRLTDALVSVEGESLRPTNAPPTIASGELV